MASYKFVTRLRIPLVGTDCGGSLHSLMKCQGCRFQRGLGLSMVCFRGPTLACRSWYVWAQLPSLATLRALAASSIIFLNHYSRIFQYSSEPSIVPVEQCRLPAIVTCEIAWNRREFRVVAVCGLVPFAAIVPIFPTGNITKL